MPRLPLLPRALPVRALRVLLPALCAAIAGVAPRLPAQGQAVAQAACGPGAVRRTLHVERITGAAPVIDGRLDEAVWRTAPAARGFVQQRPNPGKPADDSAVVRVLADDRALYIGFRIYRQHPATIAATVSRRDYYGYSDWAQVLIDSYHDRRTAWRFAVNPAGVQKDALEYDDGGGEDLGWDAVYESAAHVDSLGWTAELRIPYSQLRFSTPHAGSAGTVWGIDFDTDDASKNERAFWAPIPLFGTGLASCFGDLTGLGDLSPKRSVEAVPYASASDTRAPIVAANPLFQRDHTAGKIGGDLRYALTSDLTLAAAINPDFGQVEADPSVINLTAFETYFQEKRPLFLEGEQLFTFGIGFGMFLPGASFANDQPFYSRRIGRAPQGAVPDSAVYSDVPQASTILGAAKMSGKTAGGWSVGMLDAVTQRETARYTTPGGLVLHTPVEPLTNYAVARAIKDFRHGDGALGAIATATDRDIGTASLQGLRSGAFTGGVDGRLRFHQDTYELTGSALGSSLRGSTRAITAVELAPGHWYQRPDAGYLRVDSTRTSLAGAAASAGLARIKGRWRWQVAGHLRTPGFDMNDLGYQQTADWLIGGAQLGYVVTTPNHVVRDWNVYGSVASGWTFGGQRRATGMGFNSEIDFASNWIVVAQLNQSLPALSVDALRGGPALRTPAATTGWVWVSTDQRRRAYVTLLTDFSHEPESGAKELGLNPVVDVRPSGRMELSVGPYVSWAVNPWQYVAQQTALGAPHYVVGRVAQTTAALTVRLDYSFTPRLTLQFYGEPFVGAGSYGRFLQVADPRASRFADRFHAFAASQTAYVDSTRTYQVDLNGDGTPDLQFGNPDFNLKQFRSTTVLRWEYRRGSALYVVWSQNRSGFDPTGRFALGPDVSGLFRSPATNTLLVKFSRYVSW